MSWHPYDDERKEIIVELYMCGIGTPTIIKALNLGCSEPTLRTWLKNNGIEIRTRGASLKTRVMEKRACKKCLKSFIPQSSNHVICKTCLPTRQWQTRYQNRGITKPEFDAIFEEQNGLCDLCEQPLPENPFQIDVDHCHLQGHIRGLLHRACNQGLGYIEDDKFMGQAFRYIQKHRK